MKQLFVCALALLTLPLSSEAATGKTSSAGVSAGERKREKKVAREEQFRLNCKKQDKTLSGKALDLCVQRKMNRPRT